MEVDNNYNDYNKTYIRFQETRDFGALLGAPFSFFKQEFKLLSKALLFFAVPFVVLGMILIGYLGTLFLDFRGPEDDLLIQVFVFAGGFLLLMVVGYNMVNSVIHNYTALYIEKGKGNFNLDDIWNKVKSSSFKLFFEQLLVSTIVFIGFLFFYAPGIYLQTTLSFIYIISIKEKLSMWAATRRSFEIIKDNWWMTFLLIMVVGMILGFISYILMIPAFIIGVITGSTGEYNNAILFSGLASFLLLFLYQMFVYSIQQLAVNFQYFNLVEEKESPDLLERVNAMRTSSGTDVQPERKFSFSNENLNMEQSSLAKDDKLTSFNNTESTNETDDLERYKRK